jgi:hypothetical protein
MAMGHGAKPELKLMVIKLAATLFGRTMRCPAGARRVV